MEIYHRGLIIVEPYGTLIRNKKKTLIVKSRYINPIINEKLLLIENKTGLGIIKLGEPKEINLTQFKNLRNYHKISDIDKEKWWGGKKTLYAYEITFTNFFKNPLLLNYGTGPQITVNAKNITIKKIFIGMSGYYYKHMYPTNTDMLNFYSKNLNSLEINSTFYQLPSKSTIDKLKVQNLVYSIKVNRYITHDKKLKSVTKYWKEFYQSLEDLHDKIFCFLFQFSSNFHFNYKNFSRIEKLSGILNTDHKYAFEFRNLSWYQNAKLNELFLKNQWIFVISNVNNTSQWAGDLKNDFNPSLAKYSLTSNTVYIRMHGSVDQYKGSYRDEIFDKIFEFVKKKQIEYACIYFNNTDRKGSSMIDSTSLIKKFNFFNIDL